MLKVLYKLNLVPCRESSYTTKNKYPENYLHIIFNTKRKRKGAGRRGKRGRRSCFTICMQTLYVNLEDFYVDK